MSDTRADPSLAPERGRRPPAYGVDEPTRPAQPFQVGATCRVVGKHLHELVVRDILVGNVMIDTLLKHKEPARGIGLVERWGLKPGGFGTVAFHRSSNIYDRTILGGIPDTLNEIAKEIFIIFLMSEGLLKSAYRFLNAKILGADTIR